MLSPYVRKQTLCIQRRWSPEECAARARISRYRCAQLLASIHDSDRKSAEIWATGSMTADDVRRIAS